MKWKEFKPLWVAALRSGKYKQGKSLLYNSESNKFCCLGVGAAICGVKLENINGKGLIECVKGSSKIPSKIKGDGSLPVKLAEMNDGDGDGKNRKTFKGIATWIEKNL